MPPAAPRLLILRTGHTSPEVIERFGDFDHWIRERMAGLGCRFETIHVPDDGLPTSGRYDGVLVAGTPASVRDREGWMTDLAASLCDPCGPPVFAICFAAQLAADALGGRVDFNPRGWEIGTIEVELTTAGRDDPVFAGLEPTFQAQSTHEDAVLGLPAGVTLLAGSDKTEVQAFSAGRLHAVQFHPEAGADALRMLVRLRRARLEKDALTHGARDAEEARRRVDSIQAGIREAPAGRRILSNWLAARVLGEEPARLVSTSQDTGE